VRRCDWATHSHQFHDVLCSGDTLIAMVIVVVVVALWLQIGVCFLFSRNFAIGATDSDMSCFSQVFSTTAGTQLNSEQSMDSRFSFGECTDHARLDIVLLYLIPICQAPLLPTVMYIGYYVCSGPA